MQYQYYENELIISGVKYQVEIKILTNLNTKTALVLILNTKATLILTSMDVKIKKSSRYVLLP